MKHEHKVSVCTTILKDILLYETSKLSDVRRPEVDRVQHVFQ